jgi:two-component system chemotaxis response regulator CheB
MESNRHANSYCSTSAKNSESNFESILQLNTHYTVKEIEDKEVMQKGMLYTAPPDYHVLLEDDRTFSLDVSEVVNFSRPSIDVLFESFHFTRKMFGYSLSDLIMMAQKV